MSLRAKSTFPKGEGLFGDVMLTYQLKKSPGVPLYEALYRCIRSDILSGALAPGEKLPSKRALAQNLEVSLITVEAAYQQLLEEGYVRSREKVGYFVESVARPVSPKPEAHPQPSIEETHWLLDLTANGTEQFPFSVWSRLQREVMLDYGEKLLLPLPNQGIPELREAISAHLAAFRGMEVRPENILIGAGTDFLYNLLIQLLGRDKVYALEEPGYSKIRKIYAAGGVRASSASMDKNGVRLEDLDNADVLHCSPAHHFPSGLVTPVSRRRELLTWAQQGRWIIEDDYDSEFRFDAHPKPTLFSLDGHGRTIYMNTFSKSLAPSIRISYMVLPDALMADFRQRLGFYSCTVASFEQYTLARFLSRGHFEKHINRMRKFYKRRRNLVVSSLQSCKFSEKLTILELDAGLHFLLQVDTDRSDAALTQFLGTQGIRVHALSEYYHDGSPDLHTLVINYSGLKEDRLQEALTHLENIM